MASINKVILVGNLGKDPEIRSMKNGDKYNVKLLKNVYNYEIYKN